VTWLQFVNEFHIWWIVVTFCVSALFVLYYGIAAPWYRTPFGRALITVDAGIAVVLFPGFAKYALHYNVYEGTWDTVLTMVALSSVTISIIYRIGVLFAVRRMDKWRKLSVQRTKERKAEREANPQSTDLL
jgi:hypothetical protein